MKITICWSSSFRKEKIKVKETLKELWHESVIDQWTEKIASWEVPEILEQIHKEHYAFKKRYDLIKLYYDFIVESDAIIVCNYNKNNIPNYIWSNTFLEMWYAHVHKKKIFLLNAIPNQWYILDEIKAMEPIILDWNLTKIS